MGQASWLSFFHPQVDFVAARAGDDRAFHTGGIGSVRANRLAKGESDQARAKQHKTHKGHSEETGRSELLTHGAPPIVRPAPRMKGTTVLSPSQRDFLLTVNFDPL
jgi:hypothetical protein